MNIVVGLIDYGLAGNILSIQKALSMAGATVKIVNSPKDLTSIDKIVIPGVGSFKDAMEQLIRKGLKQPLQQTISRVPTLGICLGMQLLSKRGFEFGETEGLGFFDGETRKMQCKGPIPHMGFEEIQMLEGSFLYKGIARADQFYFMHSFEVVKYTNILSLTTYGDYKFVSSIGKGHIFGVQFHPEKSRQPGLRIFENFVRW